MQARSALFDLYGDHLRARGGAAPVAALVRLLAPFGITAPAVRTAVSRMVRQGWLVPHRFETGPGYALTARAVRRLDDAARRIYRTGGDRAGAWDRRFDLVLLDPPATRPARTRLAAGLAFLGYGPVGDRAWVAPHPSPEVDALLAESGVWYHRFRARHVAGLGGVAALVAQAWDLPGLAAAYREFVADLTPVVAAAPTVGDDETGYQARFRLVHAWRTFLFRDPQLPLELLPRGWAGAAAAEFFDRHAGRLRPAADRFVEKCL